MPETKECDTSIADEAADEHMDGAVDKIVIIARDEHILALARLDGSMNVSLRTNVPIIAMIAQIPVRLLQSLNKSSRIIRRGVIRYDNFRQLVVADLSQYICQ